MIYNTKYLITDILYLIHDTWYLRSNDWALILDTLYLWYLISDIQYLLLDIRYSIFDTWYQCLLLDIWHLDTPNLKLWYLLSVTCYMSLAKCFLLFDTFYIILGIWSLLLLVKRLFPFAPVVRLALVYFCFPQDTHLSYPSRKGALILKIYPGLQITIFLSKIVT